MKKMLLKCLTRKLPLRRNPYIAFPTQPVVQQTLSI